MNDPNAAFGDARKLEDLRFNQWLSESSAASAEKIRASQAMLASRGLSLSGMETKTRVDIMFTSIEDVVNKAIAYRQELGLRVPALLEPGNLKTMQDKLESYVDGAVNAFRQSATVQPRGAGMGWAIQEAQNRAGSVKVRLRGKLAALPLEARLGLNRKEEHKMTTLNISNSTISNLNLGSVVGDLNSSIQQLNTGGHAELAEEFRKMSEAVGSSQDLNDDARKELLEHLSVVSEESAKPPEQRKIGPLKSSLAAIRSGIAVVAQLFAVYQGLEHALRAAGVIP